jgi:hypothetical protein
MPLLHMKHFPKLSKHLVSGSSNPKPFASNLPTQNPKTPKNKRTQQCDENSQIVDVIETTMRLVEGLV